MLFSGIGQLSFDHAETNMLHRSMRAMVAAAAIVLAPTTTFACIGASWEDWAMARLKETLAEAKRPTAALAEARALRKRAASLLSEHRYDEATPVLERAMKLLDIKTKEETIKFKDDGATTATSFRATCSTGAARKMLVDDAIAIGGTSFAGMTPPGW